ncbi:MAG: hypothetical protein ACK4HV_08975, partial [Parachlamydiaceae bacterium]
IPDLTDEYSQNLALAKFICLCEKKMAKVSYSQKRLIFRVIQITKEKFTNEALRTYFEKRDFYKTCAAKGKSCADGYLYAIAINPLSQEHMNELYSMKERLVENDSSFLASEITVAMLFSYLGLGDEKGILRILREAQASIKEIFWTVSEASYFERNEVKSLSLATLIKMRELYSTQEDLKIFIGKLSIEEKGEALVFLDESPSCLEVKRQLLSDLKMRKIA